MPIKKRLTVKSTAMEGYTLDCLCEKNDKGELKDKHSCVECCSVERCCDCGIQQAINRLAEYEEIGMEPMEIRIALSENKMFRSVFS